MLLQSLTGFNIIYSAAVTAVFKMEDGSYKRFTRAVEGTSSGYRINHEVSLGLLTKFESRNSYSLLYYSFEPPRKVIRFSDKLRFFKWREWLSLLSALLFMLNNTSMKF